MIALPQRQVLDLTRPLRRVAAFIEEQQVLDDRRERGAFLMNDEYSSHRFPTPDAFDGKAGYRVDVVGQQHAFFSCRPPEDFRIISSREADDLRKDEIQFGPAAQDATHETALMFSSTNSRMIA